MSDSDYVPEDALRAALSKCSVPLPSPDTTPVVPQARSAVAPPGGAESAGAGSNADDDEGTELCDFIQGVSDASAARILDAIVPTLKAFDARFDALDKRTRQITEDFVRLNVAVSDMARGLEEVISVVDGIEESLCDDGSDDGGDASAGTPATAWAAPLTPRAHTPGTPAKGTSAAATPAAVTPTVATPSTPPAAAATPPATSPSTPPAAAATPPATTPSTPPAAAAIAPATPPAPATPSSATLVGSVHALDDESIKSILAAANSAPPTPPSAAPSVASERDDAGLVDGSEPVVVLGVAYESGDAALQALASMKLAELKQAYASLGGTRKPRTKAAIASAIVEHCYQHQTQQ